MTDNELEQLLSDIESDICERTSSEKDTDKIRKAICAFANDLPNYGRAGILFIGVDDNGTPVGLSITDRLLQTLSSMRDDGNIVPLPSIDVQKRKLKGEEVAAVFVYPSKAPPVRFKGTVWIRSGPRRGIASSDDERRLNEKRRHGDLSFDIRPVQSASIDDLDESLFRREYLPAAIDPEILSRNNRTLEHQLIATKFAHLGPPTLPTTLGILAIGKAPTDWIPGAYVQIIRFDGETLGDPIIAKNEIRGPLPELLIRSESALKLNIRTAVDLTSSDLEVNTPDYPVEALQQIFRNAILHRNYENTGAPVNVYWFNDRIEFHSPGGPYGQVTLENFGNPGMSDYRNPNLAAVMKELSFVQHFGVGIETCRSAMKRNGNPEPVFQVQHSHVAVILRRRQ
ncbi:MAG: putative DNA binding domain-containing protein [Planctomycetes bacterium]|nr:putative DNA binding domain-containing protein [Planctomycetota bacterium]